MWAENSEPGAYVNSWKGEDHSSVLSGPAVGSRMSPGMSWEQTVSWEMPGLCDPAKEAWCFFLLLLRVLCRQEGFVV